MKLTILNCSTLLALAFAHISFAETGKPAAPDDGSAAPIPAAAPALPFDVQEILADPTGAVPPLAEDDDASAKATGEKKRPSQQSPSPAPKPLHPPRLSDAPPATAQPTAIDSFPINGQAGHDNRAAILEAPTLLLFLSGYHLKIVSPPQPEAAGAPSRQETPQSDIAAEAPAAADPVHGLVTITLPIVAKNDTVSAISKYPTINILDRSGSLKTSNDKDRRDVVERPILRDILNALSESEKNSPPPELIRNILDLVIPVAGITVIDENAGRLARILDQAVSLKSDEGARGAVVYVHGEVNQTFFDNLNVSGLGIPITRYKAPPQSPSPDAPEGYGDLTDYPATAVICEKGQIVSKLHLSNDDLQNLGANSEVKKMLIEFLKLFPEPQDKDGAVDNPTRDEDPSQQKSETDKSE